MTTSTGSAPSLPTPGHADTRRQWLSVVTLWAASVGGYALILFLLVQHQVMAVQGRQLTAIAEAAQAGALDRVEAWATPVETYYPTSAVVQFAAMGLAVVATAWLGRRLLAWALTATVLVAPLAAAPWGQELLVPRPPGEGDTYLWGALAQPTSGGPPLWPLVLGAVVQVALLQLPLLAAPRVPAPVPAREVVQRALLPAAVFAVVTLAVVPPPTAREIFRAPMIAVGLTLLVIALMTGGGPAWVRLCASVAVPAAITPMLLEATFSNSRQVVGGVAVAAGCAAAVVLVSAAVHRTHRLLVRRPAAAPAVA